MDAENLYKEILTSLIQKQMLLVGKDDALRRVANIQGIKVNDEGHVLEIDKNLNKVLDSVLEAFTNFSSLMAAKQIIEAKSQQAKEIREQIASGWLQIQHEKAHLTSALESLFLGFITTNQELQIQTINPATDKILGPSPSGKWSINEIQSDITGEYFLPIQCKKCMELMLPLPPEEVRFKQKNLKFFISPIKTYNLGEEQIGVTIVIEDLS